MDYGHQAPPFMEFFLGKEYWSWFLLLQEDLPNQGSNPGHPAFQEKSLGHLSHQGKPQYIHIMD